MWIIFGYRRDYYRFVLRTLDRLDTDNTRLLSLCIARTFTDRRRLLFALLRDSTNIDENYRTSDAFDKSSVNSARAHSYWFTVVRNPAGRLLGHHLFIQRVKQIPSSVRIKTPSAPVHHQFSSVIRSDPAVRSVFPEKRQRSRRVPSVGFCGIVFRTKLTNTRGFTMLYCQKSCPAIHFVVKRRYRLSIETHALITKKKYTRIVVISKTDENLSETKKKITTNNV